jgi:hypothetical protein
MGMSFVLSIVDAHNIEIHDAYNAPVTSKEDDAMTILDPYAGHVRQDGGNSGVVWGCH